MAKVIYTKKGSKIVLLNPAEKARRFSRQLKNSDLKKHEATYRMGYLQARADNAKAYKANKKKYN